MSEKVNVGELHLMYSRRLRLYASRHHHLVGRTLYRIVLAYRVFRYHFHNLGGAAHRPLPYIQNHPGTRASDEQFACLALQGEVSQIERAVRSFVPSGKLYFFAPSRVPDELEVHPGENPRLAFFLEVVISEPERRGCLIGDFLCQVHKCRRSHHKVGVHVVARDLGLHHIFLFFSIFSAHSRLFYVFYASAAIRPSEQSPTIYKITNLARLYQKESRNEWGSGSGRRHEHTETGGRPR